MSVSDLSLVNQRLSYARILLDDLKNKDSLGNSLKSRALLDASIFHLNCAYSHYLREIRAQYLLPVIQGAVSIEAIRKELKGRGIVSGELDELAQLEASASNWLKYLQAAFNQCWEQVAVDSTPSNNMITVVNLDAAKTVTPTLEGVLLWSGALIELISRQRESSVEY